MKASELEEILKKAEQETVLSHTEILRLLAITKEDDLARVSAVARRLRTRYFGNKVFLYGFVYFSTYCRNNCSFCLYRSANHSYPRYRKTSGEILAAARQLMQSGVHLLDLTMGEDPLYHDSQQGFEELAQIVNALKRETGTAVMISPGVIARPVLAELKAAGADWYACYQETHTRTLYSRLRLGQSFAERMQQKQAARDLGYLIEEGLLAGIGESNADIAYSLQTMKNMAADQVRVMTFIPQASTPLADWPKNSPLRELLIIAVMRLVMPDRLIPASLDVDGLKGLDQRLQAGANVVTSLIPPAAGMAGVSQSSLDIHEGNRTVAKIMPVLAGSQLAAATADEYQDWLTSRQRLCSNSRRGGIRCG